MVRNSNSIYIGDKRTNNTININTSIKIKIINGTIRILDPENMGVAPTIIFLSATVSELWPIFQIVVMAEFYVLCVDKICCYHHTP